MFQHYLLTPYNGCIVARNINRSITCLIVQSKNGVGFNPCHLSLATDLKLAHWTAVAHAHMTLKHEHLIYSLVDFRSLYSFQATWDHGFGQLISSRVLLHQKYFQELFFSTFPCSQLSRWWVSQTRISHSKSCIFIWPEWSLTSYSQTLEVSTSWQVLKIQLQK